MNKIRNLILAGAAAVVMAGCASTPDTIEELQTARAVVPQVEASPRAGIAATYISEARKALDRANRLAEGSGKAEEVQFEARVATLNAEIANEKILTAQAREEIDKGTAERQAVLIEARERESQRRGDQAELARQRADAASTRAKSLEEELAALKAKPTPRGMVLTLGDVLFDTAQATLSDHRARRRNSKGRAGTQIDNRRSHRQRGIRRVQPGLVAAACVSSGSGSIGTRGREQSNRFCR
jgi:hypothetical protein